MTLKNTSPATSERGAIMLLLILLLVPILILVSMALDSSRLSTSDTELERIANSMSLGALETFLLGQGDFESRENAAKERAVRLANLKENELLAAGDNEFEVSDFGPNGPAEMTFGRWFFEEPGIGCDEFNAPPGSTCPCNGATFTGPCFVPSTDDIVANVNAARLSIRTQSNIISSIFGNLTDLNSLQLRASSTVAAVPRNGVFLVDLSRSTQFSTHLPFEQLEASQQSRASEFAFRLATTNTGAPLYTCADIANSPNGPTCNAAGWDTTRLQNYCNTTFSGAEQSFIDTCMTQCPPITPFSANNTWHQVMQINGSSSDPTVHFRSDYQCQTIAVTQPDGTQIQEHYLIERGQTGKEPEPLNTILGGIYQAMQTLRQRSIAGDTITLIGFDGQILPFTDPPLRSYGPARIDTNSGSLFTQIEDLTNPNHSFDKKIAGFLFPGAGPNRGQTDISGALITARDLLLDQDNFNVARNFVVLFSDGIASCYHKRTPVAGCMFQGDDLNTTQCLSPTPENVANYGNLTNGYNIHQLGLKEATQVLSRLDGIDPNIDPANNHSLPSADQANCGGAGNQLSYFELGIRFHYFAIGNNVRPFSWSQANAAHDSCATEEQLLDAPMDPTPLSNQRGLFMKLTHGDCNLLPPGSDRAACNAAGTNNSYYGLAHQMFSNYGTYQTRGLYAPIRPPCPLAPGETNIDEMMTRLQNKCADATQGYEYVDHGEPYTISEGSRKMLICDPKGRDAATQILENIQTVYGENPFVIVE